jgi:hypothetical protein
MSIFGPELSPPVAHFLVIAVIISNVISSFVIFAMAQVVTKDWGIHCHLAALQMFQRTCLWFLAIALMVNAINLFLTMEPPTISALMIYFGFMLACVASFLRHRLSPRIPSGATWKNPAIPVRMQLKG